MLNWAIGIDMYTLMCIKLMPNKNLQYKKTNKTKQKQKKKHKESLSFSPSLPLCPPPQFEDRARSHPPVTQEESLPQTPAAHRGIGEGISSISHPLQLLRLPQVQRG